MSLNMRDDGLDLLGVDHVVGQVVVDLGVGEVAALLAEHDQVLQPRAARLGFGRRQLRAFEFAAPCLPFALCRSGAGALLRRLGDRLLPQLRAGFAVGLSAAAALPWLPSARPCSLAAHCLGVNAFGVGAASTRAAWRRRFARRLSAAFSLGSFQHDLPFDCRLASAAGRAFALLGFAIAVLDSRRGLADRLGPLRLGPASFSRLPDCGLVGRDDLAPSA